MDDDLLFACTGLQRSASLKVKEESALTLVQGVYPPGIWTEVNATVVADVAAVLCLSDKPHVQCACLAILLRFPSLLQPQSGLGARVLSLLGRPTRQLAASDAASIKTMCAVATFPDANAADLAAAVLIEITRAGFVHAKTVRSECFADVKAGAPARLVEYGRASLARAERKSLFLRLVENMCFENTAGAGDLAAYGVMALVVPDALDGYSLEALRALTNVTNECPRAVIEAMAEGAIAKTLAGLKLKSQQLCEGGSSDDLSLVFDACVMMLGTLANIAEQPSGLKAFCDSPALADDVAALYARLLPVRALALLNSGDTASTIEFGWTPEELVLSAHVCLVVGFLVRDDALKCRLAVALPGKRGFSPLIQTLDVFLEFQREAGVLTREAETSIRRVAGYLNVGHSALMLPPPGSAKSKLKTQRPSGVENVRN